MPSDQLEIVIVDDHDDTREVAAEVLRMQGFSVRDFARAEDALDAMQSAPPDAALIDLTLETMSGEDLARRLRASGTAGRTALVAMTGHSSARENVERLWDRVLIKPVDPFELANTLRALVGASS
jgi:DNA-binding response OmpR family regulator